MVLGGLLNENTTNYAGREGGRLNLEDVLDTEYGTVNSVHSLQQDDWSLSKPKFGEEGQLEVVGWSGKNKCVAKYYILRCTNCFKDKEMFGEGYFKSAKASLVKGSTPCGCSHAPRWSKDQYRVLCSRKATDLGYTFIGFEDEWKGAFTKVRLFCQEHGEWCGGVIHSLTCMGKGCPACGNGAVSKARTKPDDVMVKSFLDVGSFHSDTKFWRSGRKNKTGNSFWFMSCPDCGEVGESKSGDLQRGHRPCACSKQRQQEAYLNWLVDDHNNAVALKFGIANNSKQRVKEQNSSSIYEVRQYQVYTFPDVYSCKAAERACLQSLVCGIVSKTDMKDGWSETTSVLNLNKVRAIYEKHGGVLQEEVE